MNTVKSLLVIFLVAHFRKICGCYLYLQYRTHLKTLTKYHPNEPLKNWQSRKIDPYKFKWFKSNYPVILLILCYLPLGPYYKYRTYQDMIYSPRTSEIPSMGPLIPRLKQLPLIGVTYLFFSYFFNIQVSSTTNRA